MNKKMKLGCPICHSKFALSELMHEAALQEMIDLAARFGKNWGLVYDYTDCFRSSQWGSVGEAKRMRILRDIDGLFAKTEFEYDGRKYRTDWVKVIAAIRAVVDAEKFGFKNHNYLKKVLLGEKAEKLSVEGLTAKEESKKEEKRRSGIVKDGQGLEDEMTATEYMRQAGIVSLASQIGKKF